jgi:hypothetical protein
MDHACNIIDVLDVTNEAMGDICVFIWWVFWKVQDQYNYIKSLLFSVLKYVSLCFDFLNISG